MLLALYLESSFHRSFVQKVNPTPPHHSSSEQTNNKYKTLKQFQMAPYVVTASGVTANHLLKFFILHNITAAELRFSVVLMWNCIGPFRGKKDNHRIRFLFCILHFPFFPVWSFSPYWNKGVSAMRPTNSVPIISNCSRKHTLKVNLKNRNWCLCTMQEKKIRGQDSTSKEIVSALADLLLWFSTL